MQERDEEFSVLASLSGTVVDVQDNTYTRL